MVETDSSFENNFKSILEDDNGTLWISRFDYELDRLFTINTINNKYYLSKIEADWYYDEDVSDNDTTSSYVRGFDTVPEDILVMYNEVGGGLYFGTMLGLYYISYDNLILDSLNYYIDLIVFIFLYLNKFIWKWWGR